MKVTIGHFLSMITALSGEKNLDSLLATITQQTLEVSRADAAVLFLLNESGTELTPVSVKFGAGIDGEVSLSAHKTANNKNFIIEAMQQKSPEVHYFKKLKDREKHTLTPFFKKLNTENLQVLTLPLSNRSGIIEGILCVINDSDNANTEDLANEDRISFMQTLSGFGGEGQVFRFAFSIN